MARYRGIELTRMMGLVAVELDEKVFYATSMKNARWLVQKFVPSQAQRILDMNNE